MRRDGQFDLLARVRPVLLEVFRAEVHEDGRVVAADQGLRALVKRFGGLVEDERAGLEVDLRARARHVLDLERVRFVEVRIDVPAGGEEQAGESRRAAWPRGKRGALPNSARARSHRIEEMTCVSSTSRWSTSVEPFWYTRTPYTDVGSSSTPAHVPRALAGVCVFVRGVEVRRR